MLLIPSIFVYPIGCCCVCLVFTFSILLSIYPWHLLLLVYVLCILIVLYFIYFYPVIFPLLLGFCNKLISPTGDKKKNKKVSHKKQKDLQRHT